MPATFAGYAPVQEYLFGLKARGVKFGIDRMRILVEALGHPERLYPVIHVAGTNGKGSVSAMLDAILHSAGWRTGLYTSPHLVRLGERVQVNRRLLSEDEIVAYVNELRPVAEQPALFSDEDHPSFFEFMTAMAFLQFARRGVDLAIAEVGLGGRLDATNVVQPELAVITSIGLDHCELLGDRLDLIAAEKAGIIKPGRPLVLGRVPAVAEEVIRRVAAERSARVVAVREVFGDDLNRYPHTNLEGDYQRWNAATATLAARLLPARWGLTEEIIAGGLLRANWPGRWQRLRVGGRTLILDASHNPEGAQVLDANLTRLRAEAGRPPVIVTGALGEYRARALLEVIARHAREIHLVVPHQARACGYAELEHCIPPNFAGRIARTTVDAVFPAPDRCAVGSGDEVVVVTGSIYLTGEVFERLEPRRGPGEGRLQDF
ncbi:MAG TPA: folylpolyglutamate synthase/dihydrofolate synthase family protein [Opitutaceae bacterium]|nr:folylpolyglutamate synthase/dihydrofolate synthase family protein [Opitutaceae bacterium]